MHQEYGDGFVCSVGSVLSVEREKRFRTIEGIAMPCATNAVAQSKEVEATVAHSCM